MSCSFVGTSPVETQDSEESGDSLCTSELCQEKHILRTELEARRVARRKLLMACVVSLIFMTGEMIGKVKNTFPDLFYTIHWTLKFVIKFKFNPSRIIVETLKPLKVFFFIPCFLLLINLIRYKMLLQLLLPQQLWDVFLPSNSKWQYFFHKMGNFFV